ncbi:MAG: MCE family protein [Deltaproteobacteria bacterium]|nr:MCE family protein [Deltaproteobacteria bacterium]
MTEQPVIRKKRGISAVWILPILALSICGWILYSSYQNRGAEITIYFQDATGLTSGKTRVMAKGIPVGMVKSLTPDLKNKRVKATVKIDQLAVEYLVEDTLFWVVRPELSAGSIQGLDTILSGSYIGIRTGSSTKPQYEFTGLESNPPIARDTPGLHIQLRAEALGSIQAGTNVYYRNIEIGNVESYRLEQDQNVLIDLFVKPQYTHLVRTKSRFCNVSGVQINGKLPNLKIRIESLASIVRGGILLYTPEQLQENPEAENGHIFQLYPDYESANYGVAMTLKLASGEGIAEGSTKIMYRGLEAGFVKEVRFNNDKHGTVTAHILLDPRAELILRENTRFWIVKPEIGAGGIKHAGLLISGPYITFELGEDGGAFKNSFEILPKPPPLKPLRPGKSFVLTSKDSSLSVNSPVYFRNIKVGEVIDVDLDESGKETRTTVFIYQQYLSLLSEKSVFWTHHGLEMEADFTGVKISTGPLTRMLYGGVSFTTPGKAAKKHLSALPEGKEFPLYTSYRNAVESVKELRPRGKRFLIRSENAKSLSIGAPILHKNIKIGSIEDFRLTKNQKEVLIECFVRDNFRNLINKNSRFYNASGIQVSGGLSGLNVQTGSLQSIFSGGIGVVEVSGTTGAASGTYPLYDSLKQALHADETELIVHLEETYGLKEGAPVRYKGVAVGEVMKLSFSKDLQIITARIRVANNIAPLFRTQTRIWVAQAELNLSKVKNLDTIIFGSFLTFLPGKGAPTRTFMALNSPPYTEIAGKTGLGIILETSHLGSLGEDSPVYYRQVKVGRVTGSQLSPSFKKVLVFVSIDAPYLAIIRNNTKFWNVSGARIEGGIFSGITVSTESMESIMKGGIALATPDNEQTGAPAAAGQHFSLHDKVKKEWLDWSPDIIVLEEDKGKKADLLK